MTDKDVAVYTRLVAEYSDLLLLTGKNWTPQVDTRMKEIRESIAKMKVR